MSCTRLNLMFTFNTNCCILIANVGARYLLSIVAFKLIPINYLNNQSTPVDKYS